MKLEEIISYCCNEHTQKHYISRDGDDDDTGRQGYPATFSKAGCQTQSWELLTGGEIDASVIMDGVYKFGADRIPVYRNLDTLLTYLETHYDLRVPK
ncbi:hypothetical protein N1030_02385 [Desulfovibrio mangrovi]|uniref:hypothetical protein n=1 Tax=Desulfovibrio mangrovi TaxID=2976983 RepID=UPI00224535AC|nr:hypothetical protein [Desulfovibrio mangrovi]UZP67842.1 hypothetical protein N1030_02385 [Desulfovibrio mangrovi]